MKLLLILICFALAAPLAAQQAPVMEAHVDGEVRGSDIRVGPDRMTGQPPVLWTGEISQPGADYIRLLLRIEGEGFDPAAFVRLVSALDQSFDIPLSTIGPEGYWTNLMPLGRVRLALVSQSVPQEAALIIENLAVQSAKGSLYSTWGEMRSCQSTRRKSPRPFVRWPPPSHSCRSSTAVSPAPAPDF